MTCFGQMAETCVTVLDVCGKHTLHTPYTYSILSTTCLELLSVALMKLSLSVCRRSALIYMSCVCVFSKCFSACARELVCVRADTPSCVCIYITVTLLHPTWRANAHSQAESVRGRTHTHRAQLSGSMCTAEPLVTCGSGVERLPLLRGCALTCVHALRLFL